MGILTGKYMRESVAEDIGSPRAKGAIKTYGSDERTWAALDVLHAIADDRGLPIPAIALAWLRAQETVLAPIASARTPEQLQDLLPLMTLELTDDEVAALSAATA